jgi:NADPH:quinone reductase-like Zn-dependent oxidoreductase
MLALVAAPEREEKVELREVPEPEPQPNEVLLEVDSVSLNRGEVNRLAMAADGWRPGWDVAGVVRQPARDGSGPPAGARVVGLSNFGGWSKRLAIPGDQVALIPDGVSFSVAATLPVAGVTALRLLWLGGLLLERRVLITGASGGVGRIAIQLARQSGALVTAIVGSPERGTGLKELGAAEVVVGIENAAGEFHLILDAAGGSSLAHSLKLVGRNGTVAAYGNSAREQTTFLVNDFYLKFARLVGFFIIGDMVLNPVGGDLAELLALVAAGRLDPQLALEASWREAASALRALRERRVPGKAVLHLD